MLDLPPLYCLSIIINFSPVYIIPLIEGKSYSRSTWEALRRLYKKKGFKALFSGKITSCSLVAINDFIDINPVIRLFKTLLRLMNICPTISKYSLC